MNDHIAVISTRLNQIFEPYRVKIIKVSALVSEHQSSLKIVLVSKNMREQSNILSLLIQTINEIKDISFNKIKIYCYIDNSYNIWIHEQDYPLINIDNKQDPPHKKAINELPNNELQADKLSILDNNQKNYKQVTQIEFQQALQSCQRIAIEAYNVNMQYTEQIEGLLQSLHNQLSNQNSFELFQTTKLDSGIFQTRELRNLELSELMNKIITEIEQVLNKDLDQLRVSLSEKKERLEDYTVALFGRTKAGKSTIREALNKGDGATIGKGGQRTTREVIEYKWQELKLIDTPGIEAYNGDEDTAKANETVDKADIIIYLITDDSVQVGEFVAMARLNQINKYFIVLLNVKKNLGDVKRIQRFLQKPERVFDAERLSGHHSHLKRHIEQYLEIEPEQIDIIDIHAMAAFLSTQEEYKDFSDQLWSLSRLSKLYDVICNDIYYHGKQRRVATIFEGTNQCLNLIIKNLLSYESDLKKQINFSEAKKIEMNGLFNELIRDSKAKVNRKVDEVFSQLSQELCQFIDHNMGKNGAEQVYKQITQKYIDRLHDTLERVFKEIQWDMKEKIQEFEAEYSYDVINIDLDGFVNIDPVNLQDFVKIVANIIAGLAIFLTPLVAIGAAILNGVIGFFRGRAKEKEKQEFNRKREDRKRELINKIYNQKQKAIHESTKQVTVKLENVQIEILRLISLPYTELSYILEEVTKVRNNFQNIHNQFKKDYESLLSN